MSQSLVAKLDQLQQKVSLLTKTLSESHRAAKHSKERIALLAQENEQLRKKVELAQQQVNRMLGQWFPELELTSEDHNEHA
ncbi:MAG: hypothetical protein HC848_06595 [Limnobacter sp.]|nr:hypothetical protein [Limnobacter sp.]